MSTVDGRVNEVVILHLVLGSLDSTFDPRPVPECNGVKGMTRQLDTMST